MPSPSEQGLEDDPRSLSQSEPEFEDDPSVPFEVIADRLFALMRERDGLEKRMQELGQTNALTAPVEYAIDVAISPISRRIVALSKVLARRPARTLAQLLAKAEILKDRTGGETGDLLEDLACTMASDVIDLLQPLISLPPER